MVASNWFWVTHEDGTKAPYDADELTPLPVDRGMGALYVGDGGCELCGNAPGERHGEHRTAPPTTAIGRLRAIVGSRITSRGLAADLTAAIDDVEGELAAVQAAKAVEIEAVLAKHRVAVGITGPMPVRRGLSVLEAMAWAQSITEMSGGKASEVAAALLNASEGKSGPETDSRGEGGLAPTAAAFLAAAEADPLAVGVIGCPKAHDAMTACSWCDPQHRAMWPHPEPVRAAPRPRVGGWVDYCGNRCVFDDRGHQVASRWHHPSGGFGWSAHRAFAPIVSGIAPTAELAEAAASAVLATWADVEGRAVKSEESPLRSPQDARLIGLHAERREIQHHRRLSVATPEEVARLGTVQGEIDALEVEEATWFKARRDPGAPGSVDVDQRMTDLAARIEALKVQIGAAKATSEHSDTPGGECVPCTAILGHSSPCAISHDVGPGAYDPSSEIDAIKAIIRRVTENALLGETCWRIAPADYDALLVAIGEKPDRETEGGKWITPVAEPVKASQQAETVPGLDLGSGAGGPLSFVCARDKFATVVELSRSGDWRRIDEHPRPPSPGLWRWVGSAEIERDEQVGGWDFEGTWTALPVPT